MFTSDVAAPQLVGRRPELAMAARAVDGARGGRSTALVVSGGPGIGKTALLAATHDLAHDFQVVSARGIQSESALAYAGLAELLRPLVGLLPRLPGPQRTALEGALAIAPPGRGDRFAVYAATVGLLSAAAEQGPLLCLVDDAHAMDTPSVEAVLFAARRLGHEGVVMLVATRPATFGGPRMSGLPTVHLGGLADDDARRLLRSSRVAAELAPWVEEAILAAAAGNPLALRELPEALPGDQRAGCAPLSEPLRPGGVVTAAFRDRLESLSAGARRAALLAACSTDGDPGAVLAALAVMGGGAADLDAAEAAGVVEVMPDRVLMSHPVLRSVAVELAGGPERRAAHRAMAEALGPQARERWAWHRAQSALGPDEEAASALAAYAASAGSRTGSAAAAAGYDRSARLTGDPDLRAARLLAASGAALEAGRPSWALQLAGEALMLTGDPMVRDGAEYIRGMALLTTGDVAVAHRLLVQGVSDRMPEEHAVDRLANGAYCAVMSDDPTGAFAAARRALAVARRLGEAECTAQAMVALATARSITGDLRGAREHLNVARALTRGVERTARTVQLFACMSLVEAFTEDLAPADAGIRALIDALRAQGAVGGLAFPLGVAAEIALRMGAWPEALAAAQEAQVIAEEAGQDTSGLYALAVLTRLEACLGHDVDCRRTAARCGEMVERTGARNFEAFRLSGLGLLELGRGNPEAAREHLVILAGRRAGTGVGSPTVVQWRPDLIEALVRLGRRDEAVLQLRVFAEEAHRSGSRWAAACVSRCRGLLAGPDHDQHFAQALHVHRSLRQQPFERARTLLAYGERLRRDRRRAEARTLLSDALATFEALGATPWAHRAREELDASGLRARTRDPAVTDRLTPRELQVALAVARGATNREAAAKMFLSEKTIERHLGNVYRKLGLRSRSQLARRFADRAGDDPA
ncbi:MAG: AAA family ATPase [Thermoleophilia bacterium]|nr:AAA family ATPase [Thermoleophilia bacterium]